MSDTDFPDDLKKAQAELHRARAEYRTLCQALPWSVEPLPGWPGTKHPHTDEVTGGREASPGYTAEQAEREAALWARIRELSIQVSTHPHWSTVEQGPKLVDARMALKSDPDVLAAAGDALAA
ncbi:hypothetical protein [Streptomyces omiyaensis]|uniref:hypothetical protein n=1 Tax=Streptomyces omiyaensis TaxID=68247 RepID=UPI0036F510A5